MRTLVFRAHRLPSACVLFNICDFFFLVAYGEEGDRFTFFFSAEKAVFFFESKLKILHNGISYLSTVKMLFFILDAPTSKLLRFHYLTVTVTKNTGVSSSSLDKCIY